VPRGLADGRPDLVEGYRRVVRLLVVAAPGDHAVPAVAERRHETERVAGGVDGQHVGRRLGQPDIGEHHRADRGPARKRQPQQGPHGAAHSVGTHDERRPVRVRLPVAADVDVHPVGVLAYRQHLGTLDDARTVGYRAFREYPLGLVLRGDQQVRKAAGQSRQVDGQLAEQPQLRYPLPGGDQLVGQAARVEHLQGAGVDRKGPGEVGLPGAPFKHGDGGPGLRQVARE
jgi:hypothetical protein